MQRVTVLVAAAFAASLTSAAGADQSLADARRGHDAGVTGRSQSDDAPPTPPAGTFNLVRYPAPPGELAAYLTPPPKGSGKHPAIVWIGGGDSAAIGDMWTEQDPTNDQSASAFRKAGIVLMVISLRGGNDNPGEREGLYGEVDDVKAAGDYLARQPYVDPARIYLGGHSTGATLTLLTMASTSQFRAAFAFGPMATPSRTYMAALGVQVAGQEDLDRRAPIRFLHAIKAPTTVIEGENGNAKALAAMRAATANPNLRFHLVERASHFTVLGRVSELVAKRILKDTGPAPAIVFTDEELTALFKW